MSREHKIKELEEEISKTKYNKATQHHIGLLKAKIARLKDELETKKRGKSKTEGYVVRKSGDATVVMVGFPSVGKSTLLNRLTNAESKVAAYEFTTLTLIPGVLEYNQAKIQIFDVPGILTGASDGTGRGREVLSAVRSADMVLLIIDINKINQLKYIERELYNSGVRINQTMPDVVIKRLTKGGIEISSSVRLDLNRETITNILKEFKINSAYVLIRTLITEDQLIDVVKGNRKYLPAITIFNKIDTVDAETLDMIKQKYPEAIFISAEQDHNLEQLKQEIFQKLQLIRIFLKQPGKEPDLKEPIILRQGSTLKDLCIKIHRDFVDRFKFARVWGSVKYDGQKIIKLDKSLKDRDIIELHIM